MTEISTAERRLIERIAAAEDAKESEQLTEGNPGGWWLGIDRLNGATCMRLLRHMFIAPDNDETKGAVYYTLDQSARRVLEDPSYIPPGIRLHRGEKGPFFE